MSREGTPVAMLAACFQHTTFHVHPCSRWSRQERAPALMLFVWSAHRATEGDLLYKLREHLMKDENKCPVLWWLDARALCCAAPGAQSAPAGFLGQLCGEPQRAGTPAVTCRSLPTSLDCVARDNLCTVRDR